MSKQIDFLNELRSRVAALTVARDVTVHFTEHDTNTPFRSSPLAGADGFHVEPDGQETREISGRNGVKHIGWRVKVLLGHAPYETEKGREDLVTQDCNKVSELELAEWTSTGVKGVFFEGPHETDRSDPNWWISTIVFRVELWQERVA